MNNKLQSALSWFGSATGVAVPALGFFKDFAPPIFPAIGLILVPISSAIIYFVGANKSLRTNSRLLKRSMWLVGVGVSLIFVYIIALPNWSVQIPGSDKHLQIGFGTANWSLTAIGKQDKRAIPDATPEKLLMAEAAFTHDGVIGVWASWTVALAGSVLLLSYFCGFVAWTSGFACLAKHRSNAQL
jgi:hypothetical protein